MQCHCYIAQPSLPDHGLQHPMMTATSTLHHARTPRRQNPSIYSTPRHALSTRRRQEAARSPATATSPLVQSIPLQTLENTTCTAAYLEQKEAAMAVNMLRRRFM